MKKIYLKPEAIVLEVCVESLMESFSTDVGGGDIDNGDVGAKQGFIDFEEEEASWGNVWE